MFDNIGGKIKTLTKVIFAIMVTCSIILNVIGGVVLGKAFRGVIPGLLIFLLVIIAIGLGVLLSWIFCFFMYGYGELIESSSRARANTEKMRTLIRPGMNSNAVSSEDIKRASSAAREGPSASRNAMQKVEESKAAVIQTRQRVVIGEGHSAESLLKRAFLFLEDENWESAEDYCEAVLDTDPENARAYLGKLMAKQRVRRKEELADCAQPFDSDGNYQKAIRFGDEKLNTELKGYIESINTRNETARLTSLYQKATNAMNAATTESGYRSAAEIFKSICGYLDAETLAKECIKEAENCSKDSTYRSAKSKMLLDQKNGYEEAINLLQTIPDWKDADEQIAFCRNRIAEITEKEEAARQENVRREAQRQLEIERSQKKNKRTIGIIAASVCVCIALAAVFLFVFLPKNRLNKAMELLNAGDFEAAYARLEKSGHEEIIASNKETRAALLLEEENYEEAYQLMREIGKDDLIAENKYERALALLDAEDYDSAYMLLNEIGKSEMISQNKYERAMVMLDTGNPEAAYALFREIGRSDLIPADALPDLEPEIQYDPEIREFENFLCDPIGTAEVLVNQLRIRELPSKNAEIKFEANQDDRYLVYETCRADGYTWYRIGWSAWIPDDSGDYIAFIAGYDSDAADISEDPIGSVEVLVNALRIRKSPNTDAEIRFKSNKDDRYPLYEISSSGEYTWYRIGHEAWIADKNGEYVTVEYLILKSKQVVFADVYETNKQYSALLSVKEWTGNGWLTRLSDIPAAIGSNGITLNKREGDHCTPGGEFNILFCFSDQALDTDLRQKYITEGDVWVTDQSSRYYNTIQPDSAGYKDWSKSENIYRQLISGRSYAGIFFDYNGDGESADSAIPGAGAALFLDGIGSSGDLNTGYGDIKISETDMMRLLKVLDQSLNPTFIIRNAD